MRVNELALSQAFLPSLAKAGIHEIAPPRVPQRSRAVRADPRASPPRPNALLPQPPHPQRARARDVPPAGGRGADPRADRRADRHHDRARAPTAQTALRPRRQTASREKATARQATPVDFQRTAPHVPARAADGHAQLPPAPDLGGSRQAQRRHRSPASDPATTAVVMHSRVVASRARAAVAFAVAAFTLVVAASAAIPSRARSSPTDCERA